MQTNLLRRTFFGVGAAVAVRPAAGQSTAERPALLGGDPVRKARFPSWPLSMPEDEQTWLDVVRQCKWWRKEGHYVRDFEKAWAELLGARHCVATANGTGALMASLHAVEAGPKDEVIVSPYTFIATVNAVLAQYALPVFVDTDPQTMMIDAGKIEAAITPRTRCIMPVHLGGNVADMDRILEISKRRNIPVVEDACQAHMSEWRNRKIATLGALGCFSFQKFKNLAGGEAGALVTNDESLYRHAYGFHSHYRTPANEGPANPQVARNGINLRMAEFQGALLMAQLKRLEAQAGTREQNAAHLSELLRETPGLVPAKMYEGCTRNGYHIFMMRYDTDAFSGLPRARFLQAVRAEGIPMSPGYGPLNRDPFLENTFKSRAYRAVYTREEIDGWRERIAQLPGNDRVCREGVWLGQSVLLGSKRDMEEIATAVRKVHRSAEALKKT